MDVSIADDKLKELVEKEVQKCIHNKIVNIMNDGCASWFTQQNIQHVTQRVIADMINKEVVTQAIKELPKKEIVDKVAKSLSEAISDKIFWSD